jgi:hypothetical protein
MCVSVQITVLDVCSCCRDLFTALFDYPKFGTPFKRGGACGTQCQPALNPTCLPDWLCVAMFFSLLTCLTVHHVWRTTHHTCTTHARARARAAMPTPAERYYYYHNSGLQQHYVLYGQDSLTV